MLRHLYLTPFQLHQNSLGHPLRRPRSVRQRPHQRPLENADANPRCLRLVPRVLRPPGRKKTKRCSAPSSPMKNHDSHGRSSPASWANLSTMSGLCGTRSRPSWDDLALWILFSITLPIAGKKVYELRVVTVSLTLWFPRFCHPGFLIRLFLFRFRSSQLPELSRMSLRTHLDRYCMQRAMPPDLISSPTRSRSPTRAPPSSSTRPSPFHRPPGWQPTTTTPH